MSVTPYEKTPTPRRLRIPVVGNRMGSALFWPSGSDGWSAPPLQLTSPLLIMRVNREGTVVHTPEGEIVARHDDPATMPFRWIDEILTALTDSTRGTTERRLFTSPVFPLAVVCASYEYGRTLHPHEHCFPRAAESEVDDLFVAFHATGFVLKEDRWTLVGRPPGPAATWNGWSPAANQTEWPPPPAFSSGTTAVAGILQPEGQEVEPVPALSREAYNAAVEAIHKHLRAGDIYQANLTVRFEGRTHGTADRIFAAGVRNGGDRFAALVRASNCSHISFSPELLVRKWGRSILTRPVKGTRPRAHPDDDARIMNELAASPKDRAEHVMIVDLERNDLGHLCEYGTVRVDPLMIPTKHPTLFHLESSVLGTLRSRVTVRDILSSMFPGGSVTGAPKRRALEVLSTLENRPRGLYCGALGWIDSRGDCEFNLPIRTGTLFDDRRLHLYSGGAIVADSNADDEWRELEHKLDFIRDAIHRAVTSTSLPR